MFFYVCIKSLLIAILTFFLTYQGIAEKSIVYKPSKQMHQLFETSKIESYTGIDNKKLTYLHIKPTANVPANLPIILFCHGNDGNVTIEKVHKKLEFLINKGYEIYVPDYRGYGQSEGTPEEQSIYTDMRTLIKTLGLNPANTIIWGHSLGSAIAVDTAKDLPFKGVIIEGAFTSIEDMRDYRLKNELIGDELTTNIRNKIYKMLVITQKFDTKSKIAKIHSPLLILHSQNDDVIPFQMSLDLYKLNTKAELYISPNGNHNTTGWQDLPIINFIQKL